MHQLICKDLFYRLMGNQWAKSRAAVDEANAQRELWDNNHDYQPTEEDDDSEGRTYAGPTISGIALAMYKAERDRQRGLPVLSEEFTPSSTTSDSSNAEMNNMSDCGNCGTEAPLNRPLSLCGKCSEQHYCSRKCQREHWSEHKKRCQASTSS
jgi:hypothetical protein